MKKKLFIGCAFIAGISSMGSAQVSTVGMVAYYPFNGNANDASGNNINGVVTNATLAPDRFGTPNAAYYFDGSSSEISITHNSANIDFTNTFSISFWYKPYQGFNSRAGLFYTREDASGNDQGGIGVDYASNSSLDSTVQVYKPTYLSGDIDLQMGVINPTPLPTNVWHNVTIVYTKNAKGYLYFDCVLTDSSQTSTAFYTASSPIRIGAVFNGVWTYFFKGWIDDIRIYNRALNKSEVNGSCSITGIEELETSDMKVYPNPSNGAFLIQSANEGVYSIMNEFGQTVQQFNLNSLNKYSVNIENLSNGIYFIVGFNNNQLTRQKIVVTK